MGHDSRASAPENTLARRAPGRLRAASARFLLGWALLLGASSARGAEVPAAGSREHAYFIWVPVPPTAKPSARFTSLYHLPAEAAPGVVRLGRQITGIPSRVAAVGDRLYIAHEPLPDEPLASGEALEARPPRLRRVEMLTVAPTPVGAGFYEFRPVGREPESLPSLSAEGELLSLAATERGLFALLAPAGVGGAPTLLMLRDDAWAPVDYGPPEGFAPAGMFALDGRVALVAPARPRAGAPGDARTTLLIADGAEAAANGASAWRALRVRGVSPGARFVGTAAGVVAAETGADGAVALRLIRLESASEGGAVEALELATVAAGRGEFALAPLGERVNVVWFTAERALGPSMRIATVSAFTGRTLYEGPIIPGPVVSARGLLTLALLLGAALLTALVFILRPEPADNQVILLPPDTALAGPGRRTLAASIDLLLPGAIIASATGASVREIVDASLLNSDAGMEGAGALLALVFLTILHTSLSEWLAGTTVGKRLLGCRTISVNGKRPALWQAGVRNSLKLLCPPLALFLLLDPRARHPADILARTAVVVSIRGGGAGGSSGDDGAARGLDDAALLGDEKRDP